MPRRVFYRAVSATRSKKKRPKPFRAATEHGGGEAGAARLQSAVPSPVLSPAPSGGPSARGAANAHETPLSGPARRSALVALGVFALIQVAIPLRYYLGDDLYDERFAWRMFSAVRVQECEIEVTETRAEVVTPLRPMTFLPLPWGGLLERSRPAVVHAFLDWRCDPPSAGGDPPDSVSVRSRCIDARHQALPPVVRSLECEHRTYDEHSEPAEVGR